MPPKKERAEKQPEAQSNEIVPLFKNQFGLTIDLSGRGYLVQNEWLVMCNEIFELLYERFDEEMMKKRVEESYHHYSVRTMV